MEEFYNSKYFTCEEIDRRLLQGTYDDAVKNGFKGTKDEFDQLVASIPKAVFMSNEQPEELPQPEQTSSDYAISALQDWEGHNIHEHYATREQLADIKPVVINGNVTNNADNEDLESDVDPETGKAVMHFKDRPYVPGTFRGKGYKILRQNIVTKNRSNSNILTQDMLSDSNTVYDIRYDFDLGGKEITVPEGCILRFLGGTLSNGTLLGNNTELSNPDNYHIFNNLYFGSKDLTYEFIDPGTFIIKGSVDAKWFGIESDVEENQQDKFEQLSSLICCTHNINLIFQKGIYKLGKQDSINQRLFKNTPAHLILFIGHAMLRVTGNIINSVVIQGNGCTFEDVCRHKQGWFNSDGTPDYAGQGSDYSQKKFAHCGDGILFKNAENLRYVSLNNLTVNLNYQNYEYGGAIAPSPLSHGISVQDAPNAIVEVNNARSINCITDGILTHQVDTTELRKVVLKNNVRTGFASEGGNKFIFLYCNIYNDNYFKPTLPPGVSGNIYTFERPYADLNIECTREGTLAKEVTIQYCNFGDCDNENYQLSLQGNIENVSILDCVFSRTKAVKNGAYTISTIGSVLLNNIQFYNSKYQTPNTNRGGKVIVDNIYVNAKKWETIDDDYDETKPFMLAAFASGSTAIQKNITINLLDKFITGDINNQIIRDQIVDKLIINILEELTYTNSTLGVGRLPSVSKLVINDFVTEHTIEEANRPTLNNLEYVKEFIYNKIDGSDDKAIRFIDSTYKKDIKWIKNKRYAPFTSNMIKMYNGVYQKVGNLMPDEIYFSCLTDKSTFDDLPNLSLSYKVTENNTDTCRFWIWDSTDSKFATYLGVPRRVNKLYFTSKTTFDSFCATNSIQELFAGERVMIGNKQYYAKGGSTDLLTHDGIPIDVKSSGTFAEKPLANTNIPIGYSYFCTDKQTAEGVSNGIMIYHKGNNVWVDALGRVIS